jgi:hypothetical protein
MAPARSNPATHLVSALLTALALLAGLCPDAPGQGLLFEENGGRYDPASRFVVRAGGMAVHLVDDGLVFGLLPADSSLLNSESSESSASSASAQSLQAGTPGEGAQAPADTASSSPSPGALLRVTFAGGRAASMTGVDEQLTRIHHLVGDDPAGWSVDNRTFAAVSYADVWSGVDVDIYERDGLLEYDFVVAPGVDPATVRVAVDGAEVSIQSDGSLRLATPVGDLVQRAPVLFQELDGARVTVSGAFSLGEGGTIGFDVGTYDRDAPLVIDPVLVYATFVDGGGWDAFQDVALDDAGNTYAVGLARSGDIPTTPGAYQEQKADGWTGWDADQDGYVAKLSPGGDKLLWATYLGGTPGTTGCCVTGADWIRAVALAPNGDLFLGGKTWSPDFPTTPGAWVEAVDVGVQTGFVARLSSDGSDLVASTFVGDPSKTSGVRDLAVAADGDPVLAGRAYNMFPTTPGAYMPLVNPGNPFYYAVVARLEPDLSAPVFATFYGYGSESGDGVAVDADGHVYLTGGSNGTWLPIVDGFQPAQGGGWSDTWLARFSADGSTLEYATWIGGSSGESADGNLTQSRVACDDDGRAWVSGQTDSPDFPTTAGAAQETMPNATSYPRNGFVLCIDTETAGAASLLWSTYVGGWNTSVATDVAVDAVGNAHVVGTMEGSGLPMVDPWQGSLLGSYTSGYLAVYDGMGQITRSTYFGKAGSVYYGPMPSLDLDAAGNIAVAGSGESMTGFATPGSYQDTLAGSNQGFVARFATAATGTWVDLGFAKPGLAATPHLEGLGSLLPATQCSITVTGGPANGTTCLVIGLSEMSVPCKGGLLVPFHDIINAGLTLDASGGRQDVFTWPGAAAGLQIWMQNWFMDPSVQSGWTSSNGLRVTAP